MLYVVTAATPSELFRRRVGPAFRCTLTPRHFSLCARSRDLVCERCSRQRVNECSFFVNLLHYEMYLLESFSFFFFDLVSPNLLKDVAFAPRFDWTIPPVETKLFLAMCHSESFGLFQCIWQTGIASTLMILLSRAVEKLARTSFNDRRVNWHHDILVADRLIGLFLCHCLNSCFLSFFPKTFREFLRQLRI